MILQYSIVGDSKNETTHYVKILFIDKDGFEISYLKEGFRTRKEANVSMYKKIELINKMIKK